MQQQKNQSERMSGGRLLSTPLSTTRLQRSSTLSLPRLLCTICIVAIVLSDCYVGLVVVGAWSVPLFSKFQSTQRHSQCRARHTPVVGWHKKHIGSSLQATVLDPTDSSSSVFLSVLESKKVPELRQMIHDAELNEPGLQSRLKRKSDLIDFLMEHEDHFEVEDDDDEEEDEDWYEIEDDDNDGAESEAVHKSDLGYEIMEAGDSLTSGIEIDFDESDEATTASDEPKKMLKKKKKKTPTNDLAASLDIPESICTLLPVPLQHRMANRGLLSLLPSQALSFGRIQEGRDAVLQAPTGSGKTLAYVLPLLAKKYRRPPAQKGVAQPVIITLAPSRELARQVGKEWAKFTDLPVTTVFGGVPIERHISLLKAKPFILVSTPGRLRELVRSEYVDYSEVMTLVLDEADTLLNKADSPDVYAIHRELETAVGYRAHDEYQLVMVSATINENVRDFTDELEISPRAYIRVKGSNSKVLVSESFSPKQALLSSTEDGDGDSHKSISVPTVQHWHMACKSTLRSSITADLISILAPRLTIIFVPTKSETESVASYLGNQLLMTDIRSLHGDMSQTSRSRSIALIRETAAAGISQILVATDVASRGLDLPNVDLVIQYGIPRDSGKDGTFSTELYTHRTGRTGRVRMEHDPHEAEESSNAILLYDPSVGEAKVLPKLVADVQKELKVTIQPKPIPSVDEIVQAGYRRSRETLHNYQDTELVDYFVSKLKEESDNGGLDITDSRQMVQYLAGAMAALSSLDSSVSPFDTHYSLLTRSPSDRTLRLSKQDGTPLGGPPEVTKYVKSLGSGKLGRVSMSEDGLTALFDLPTKRAKRLLENVADDESDEYILEMPMSLA